MSVPMVRIGEVVEEVKSWNPAALPEPRPIRYIDLSSVDKDAKRVIHELVAEVLSNEAPSRAKQLVAEDDVLVSTVRPNLNGVALVDDQLDGATASTGYCVLRAAKAKLDPKYLCYWVQTPTFVDEMTRLATGASYPAVSDSIIKRSEIPLPPLPTQRRIAAVLDKAQALVANDRQTLALYDQLARSLFLEMFGDPVRNERGWEVVTMGQVMRTKTQNGLYVPKDRYTEDGVQMVHMSDAFQGIVQPGSLKRVSVSDTDRAKFLLEPDDLLVARRSLNYEGSVKPCRIPTSSEPLVYESSLIRLRFNRSVVHPIFVYYYLNDDGARRHHVFKHVTSSTISGINNTGLNAIRMYLPPVHLQDRFNKLVEKIELDKVSTEASLRRSEGLFASLLQGAFRGGLA